MLPLNIKTHYSFLSSIIKVDKLVEFAKQHSLKSLTITDNNMHGVMEFYQLCVKNNLKPIVGLEIIWEDKNIILYCCNYNGYLNLIKLNSLEITLENIIAYSDDLICLMPVFSSELYSDLAKVFKYLFVGYENEREREKLSGNNLKLVYMRPIYYLNKEDSEYYKYLLAIRDGCLVSEVTYNSNNNYLMLYDEVREKHPHDLDNNYLIDELCNLELKFNHDLLPSFTANDDEYLEQLCWEKLLDRSDIYEKRLKTELAVIKEMGFSSYFLIVWDYVTYAKKNNILVGPGRGSASGSLVAYVLGITEVDPLKYNLLFERFLNAKRTTMPDIDIDFPDDRRFEVINYCLEKYGSDRVAHIVTFGSLGAKQVIRDVARVMDIDMDVVNNLTKLINTNYTLEANYNNNEQIRNYLRNKKLILMMYKIANKLEGLKRHTSLHAAGIVLSKVDLDCVVPVFKNEVGLVTCYDMEYLEEIGLLKMDFLGLKNLVIISNTLKLVKEYYNEDLVFSDIVLDDDKQREIFREGLTMGIFQFESKGMQSFLKKLQANNFEDIVAANALFRPGPLENIDSYIKRKQGLEKYTIHPDLIKVLSSTYGIIVYQEQIMQIVNIIAGYSYLEADLLRRAISKKDEKVMLGEKENFLKRSVERGYSLQIANDIYDLILKFAAYGFNRSHAVAYSMIACRMAYLKAHYPLCFMKSLLTNALGSEIKTKEYINECHRLNIKVSVPDINKSGIDYEIITDSLLCPFSLIKGIGMSAIKEIVSERENGEYKDIYDFVVRVYGKIITKDIILKLNEAGCFRGFSLSRKTIAENIDIIVNYAELIKELNCDIAMQPVLKNMFEYNDFMLMGFELKLFGFYISEHPVTKYRLKYNGVLLKEIEKYFDKRILIILNVDKINKIKTKHGEEMCFIVGSDEDSKIDMVLFPNIYIKYKAFKVGDIIKVKGKVEKRFAKLQIVVNELEILKDV